MARLAQRTSASWHRRRRQLIYTWDTRRASYSEVYSGLRNWWHVLPDGSNPLAVFVQEFEATGINAGTYQYLAGQQAYRSASGGIHDV